MIRASVIAVTALCVSACRTDTAPQTTSARAGAEPAAGASDPGETVVDVAQCCTFRAAGGRVVRPPGRPIDSYDGLRVEGPDYLLRVSFDPGPIGWEADAEGRIVAAGGFRALLAEDRTSRLSEFPTNEVLVVPVRQGERQAALTVRISCRASGCAVRDQLLATLRFLPGWSSNSALAPSPRSGI